MPKLNLSWLRNLFIPFIIIVILFVAFGAYYLYWVPNRERHLDDRGFRYLKTLSDQIRLTINTFDKIMDNARKASVENETLPAFLKLTAPQLTVPEDAEIAHAIGTDEKNYGDPPKTAIAVDEGTHFLYLAFAFADDPKTTDRRVVRTDLDSLVNGLLGPPELSPFDVILLAASDGRVIFQKSLSGVEVAQIKNLEDASGAVDEKKQAKQIDAKLLSTASQLKEVRIAGARYRLYSQPLQIGFLPSNATGNSDEQAEATWVLCGMVRADRFRSESQLIPYSYILTMLAAILLAAASYPFLRLYLSLPGERLRSRDVAVTAVFTCLIAAAITYILADVYYWTQSFGPEANAEMAKLAHAIDANFQREQQAAFVALNRLDRTRVLLQPQVVGNDQATFKGVQLLFGEHDNGKCDPQEACKVNILRDNSLDPILQNYPYLFFVFWADINGQQRIKWTTRKHATPFIPLDETSASFYPAVRRALHYPGDSSIIPSCGVGPQYSSTTGQNIVAFWGIVPLSQAKCGVKLGTSNSDTASPDNPVVTPAAKEDRIWAALVTQPVSLYNAVLPGSYQFAVVKPDGMVVFHSDTTRNLRENFLAETDMNPNLQSRVEMRSEGTVTANYMGRPHRMYVLPMDAGSQDGRWTVIIFRDLHMEEVMNLEILSLVSLLFTIYAAVTLFFVYVFGRIRKGLTGRKWFWPDSRLSTIYRRLAVINGAAVLLLLILSHLLPALGLLFWAMVIPAVVLLFNRAAIRRRRPSEDSSSVEAEVEPPDWRFNYFAAGATLVVAVAVLPCLSLFKVAADFEHRLLIENNILKLAKNLQDRAVVMRELYREMDLGPYKEVLLAGPEKQAAADLEGEKLPMPESKPVYSYHELLGTYVTSSHALIHENADPSSVENALLSFLSIPYNKRAADDRHLAEGKSDVWRWTSSSFGRKRSLELTREELGGQVRNIKATWYPFFYPWNKPLWWLGLATLLAGVNILVRMSLRRIFLLDRVPPPLLLHPDSEPDPTSLISDLPLNLLLIGHESSRPITDLLHRTDVQVYEAEVLLQSDVSVAGPKPGAGAQAMDAIIRDGRPLVLRNFERLPDDGAQLAKANAALTRLLSTLGNSVILISSIDPVLVPCIEANDRWRDLLRSFVRIDLSITPRRRMGEDDADYNGRISADSYFHWLFASLPRLKKLVLLQLAQEKVVNPNSSEIVDELTEQGFIVRKWGLLSVKDEEFAKFLKHALPRHTVRHWEKQIAGARPFSLQTSLMILGVAVVAFLLYTQGEVFNTWVTYATGVASAVPKALQFFENFRSKSASSS